MLLFPALLSLGGTDGKQPGETPGGGGRLCVCGHAKQAHEHYRRGSDCALCHCGRYRRPLLIGRRRRDR